MVELIFRIITLVLLPFNMLICSVVDYEINSHALVEMW